MGIFSFIKRNEQVSNPSAQPIPIDPINERPLPVIEESVFVENAPIVKQSDQATIPSGDNNINLLYSFLDKNHEAKGYDDALINPDTSHLNQNLEALKSELERSINKVKTFYEDFIQEIDYHITSRGRTGMIDIVEELEMKKKIAEGHMQKVLAIEINTKNNEGECKGILISYTRGFKNGLAAISHHTIMQKRF